MKLNNLFLLLLIPVFYSCQKEITGDTGLNLPDTLNIQAYYEAVIDGQKFREEVTGNNNTGILSAVSNTEDPELVSAVINEDEDGTGLIIIKGVFPDFENATQESLKSFFSPGLYEYADVNPGIIISWMDKTGNSWSTLSGNGEQSGSAFRIISASDAHDSAGKYYVQVVAEFNCNLYDSTGVKKLLTGGKYKGFFGPLE